MKHKFLLALVFVTTIAILASAVSTPAAAMVRLPGAPTQASVPVDAFGRPLVAADGSLTSYREAPGAPPMPQGGGGDRFFGESLRTGPHRPKRGRT